MEKTDGFSLTLMRDKVIAATTIVLSWAAAMWCVMSEMMLLRVVGAIFLTGKMVVTALTIVGLLRDRKHAALLFAGRYRYDGGRLKMGQLLLRHWWEQPQMWLGYCLAMARVIAGKVKRVESAYGVTFVVGEHNSYYHMGMSLSPIVNIVVPRVNDTPVGMLIKHNQSVYRHELGHTLDSMIWGWLYLPVIGVPSYLSVAAERYGIRGHKHASLYAERWAERHGDWVAKNNSVPAHSTGSK